jgi:hypothetical protein
LVGLENPAVLVNRNPFIRRLRQSAEALFALPHPLLRALALGDVHHHAPQCHRLLVLNDHRHHVPQPHGAAIGRHDAIFQLVRSLLLRRSDAKLHRPGTVLGMQVVLPKSGFREPALHGIAEQAFRLLAHKGKPKRPRIGFPHDPIDGVHEGFIMLLGLRQDRYCPLSFRPQQCFHQGSQSLTESHWVAPAISHD